MKRAAIVSIILISWPCSVSTQVINLQSINVFRFDSVPLTARTVAMGGTGIGMPDDVTAAITNPAAHRLLVRGEVAGSLFWDNPSIPVITGATLTRNPAGTLVPVRLQLQNRSQATSPSFFTAVAYPKSRATIAGYWLLIAQDPSNFSLRESSTGGNSVELAPGAGDTNSHYDFSQASLAVSMSPTMTLGIGAAVVMNHVKIRTIVPERLVTRPPPAPPTVVQRQLNAETSPQPRVGYRVGVSWAPASRVHIGGVFEKGTEHQASIELQQDFTSTTQLPTAALHVPDRVGLGVGVRVTETLRVTADVKKVRYSQLKPFLASVLQTAPADETTLDLEDATELRVGAEYVIPFASKAAVLRAGLWHDSAHSLVYTGPDPLLREGFAERLGSQTHATFGAGVVIGSVEIAGGADLSDSRQTVILSTTVRFK